MKKEKETREGKERIQFITNFFLFVSPFSSFSSFPSPSYSFPFFSSFVFREDPS